MVAIHTMQEAETNGNSKVTRRIRPNVVSARNMSPFGYRNHKQIDESDYEIVKEIYEDHLRFVEEMEDSNLHPNSNCHNYPSVAQLFFLVRVREEDTHKRVHRLTLPNTSLPELPRSILKLDALETLNLEKWTRGLPLWIGAMKSLKMLRITVLDGQTLPEELGGLNNLQHLQVIGKSRIESLPVSVNKLVNLQKLWMSLEHLPSEIGNLSNLRALHTSPRILSLPPSIGQLRHLKKLDLWAGRLTSLPDEIGNLESLEILNLESSCLTSLPQSIGNLRNLKHLNLSRMNFLEYHLPTSIGKLVSLEDLDLCETVTEANQIPSTIANLRNLKALHLSKDFHYYCSGEDGNNTAAANATNQHFLLKLAHRCPSLGCLGYEKEAETDIDEHSKSRTALAHVLMCNRINTRLFHGNGYHKNASNTTITESTTTESTSRIESTSTESTTMATVLRDEGQEILSSLSVWPLILEKSERAIGPYKGWGWGSHSWGCGKRFQQKDAVYQLLVNYGAPVLEATREER